MWVDRVADDLLSLKYRIEGHVDALRLPDRQHPAHTDGLWRGTCLEAFIRPTGERGYLELNFSPSTQWAIYGFDDYRSGMRALAPVQPPTILCHQHEDVVTADVEIHLASLGLPAPGDLQLGLAAVLQDQAGDRSYWALAHPAGKPDFHDPGSFLLTLPGPKGAG